jgi:hypothetical protein
MSLVADPIALTLDDVARLGREACGFINRIYLHWTGGHYGHVYGEYHLSIDRDGTHVCTSEDGAGADALTIFEGAYLASQYRRDRYRDLRCLWRRGAQQHRH